MSRLQRRIHMGRVPAAVDIDDPYDDDSVSSSYFRDSISTSNSREVSSNHNSTTISYPSGHHPPRYVHSALSTTSTSTSRALTSRPSTRLTNASGRRSRLTTASSILGQSDAQNIVCAISEARGVTPSVGVAFVDVALGEVILSQICDNQSYVKTIHKLQMMSPSHIIFMSTALPPNKPSTLFSLVQELMPEVKIDPFDRSAWSESSGLDYIQTRI